MMLAIILILVLQLASAAREGTSQPYHRCHNTRDEADLLPCSSLTSDDVKMSCEGHPSETLILSVLKMMKTLQWKHTIVLSDHVYSNDALQFLLPVLGLTSVFDIGDLHSSVDLKRLLQKLHKKFFPRLNFLILSNYSSALQLLVIVDLHDLESNRTTEFRHHSFWVVGCYSSCQPETSVLSHINHLENIVLIVSHKDGSSGLHQLMVTSRGRSFSPVTEFEGIEEGEIFPNRRYGLNQRTLIVSTIVSEPYVQRKGDDFEGYMIEALDSIASALNFSYEIVHPEGMRYGKIHVEDGRWDGLVGQLERKDIDMAIADLTIHQDREEVMDFLHPPIFSFTTDIVYKIESEDTGNWQMFLKPFSSWVFLILSVTLIVSTVIGYILHRCDDVITGKKINISERKSQMFISADTFFYLFGTLIIRSLESNPRNQSTRLLLFTWGMFSIIIAAYYCASFVALFAIQKPNLPFTSLGELVRQKEYKWGFTSGDIKEHIFNHSRSGDMKLAWERILEINKTDPDVLSPDIAVHVAKVKMEKYALITNRVKIEEIKSNDCNIHEVGEDILWHQLGIGVPTDYPLKTELENVLGAMFDSGLPDIWWRRWSTPKADQCIQDRSVNSLTLSDVTSMFGLLCVGLGAAGFLLVIELIIYKLQHPSNRKFRPDTN